VAGKGKASPQVVAAAFCPAHAIALAHLATAHLRCGTRKSSPTLRRLPLRPGHLSRAVLGLANLRLTVERGSLQSISRPFFSKFLSFCNKKRFRKKFRKHFGEIEKISREILEREKNFKEKN